MQKKLQIKIFANKKTKLIAKTKMKKKKKNPPVRQKLPFTETNF